MTILSMVVKEKDQPSQSGRGSGGGGISLEAIFFQSLRYMNSHE
jgi:hypothetical protein